MPRKPTERSRQQQHREWRERIPEQRRLVTEVTPRVFAASAERRLEEVPEAWKSLVASMSEQARAAEKRGREWSRAMIGVGDMLEYLMRAIRRDLGFKEGEESLASMILVKKAVTQLLVELREGADEEADTDEDRWRVLTAMRALTSRFDDVQLRRLRALKVTESGAKWTELCGEEELEARVQESRKIAEEYGDEHFDEERTRHWFRTELPTVQAVQVHEGLRAIDERFGELDPLVVLEEVAAARANTRGGRGAGGDGHVGSVRALARLAVMCGALDYRQADGEEFDTAVDRARSSLLVTRSRIRKELRNFPGQVEEPDGDEQE